MATDAGSLKIITTWLSALSDLVPPTAASPLTKNRIATLTMQLAEIFPSGAFTPASMREVAAGKEFFPGWEGLVAGVERWWAANKPQQARLPQGAQAADLDAMDASWLRYWHEHQADRREHSDRIAAEREAAGRSYDRAQLPLTRLASLVRAQSPKAWAIISNVTSYARPEPTDAEADAVRESVARTVQEIHGIAGGPRWTPPASQQLRQLGEAPAPALPPPSAEVLRQRAENPAVQAAKAAGGLVW